MVGFKTVRELDISGQRLLIRVDFNVPLSDDGQITNERRIQAALPTLRYCLDQGASLVLMAHLGRPQGKPDPQQSLRPLAERLEQLLEGTSVELVDDYTNWSTDEQRMGGVALLENLRFHEGEKQGDEQFAHRLRELGDIYVNDAFATCHRKHASMFAVPQLFPEGKRVIGLLVQRELEALDELLQSPQQPMVAVLGGAKVADKIDVVEALLDRVDSVLVGGAMAYTFMKARGDNVGASRVEEDKLEMAARVLQGAGDKLLLPTDHVIADEPRASARVENADGGIPEGWYGMDIGPRTIELYTQRIADAATVVWNGPLGKFEDAPFRQGTEAIVRALAQTDAKTVVGGGESGEAVEQFHLVDEMDHVSTGGGAFLKYLEKGELPALSVIDQRQPEQASTAGQQLPKS